MNCQEFETCLIALADERLLDANLRKQAFAHSVVCERCAARLAHERGLARGLQALAESTAQAQPRHQLKAALRAAYDQQTGAAPVVAAVNEIATSNVIPLRPRQPQKRFGQTTSWAWAAAASLLAMFALGMALWLRNDNAPAARLVFMPSPTPLATPAPTEMPVQAAPANLLATNDPAPVVRAKTARKATIANAPRFVTPHLPATHRELVTADPAGEYITLNNTTAGASTNDSIVVRVKVPRASLLAMGLPLNGEKADTMISADLKVDMNGTPLAIRLVE